jgi:integrase
MVGLGRVELPTRSLGKSVPFSDPIPHIANVYAGFVLGTTVPLYTFCTRRKLWLARIPTIRPQETQMQRGRIERRGKRWLLRYRETVIENGHTKTRQAAKTIARYPEYRTAASVQHLAQDILGPINARTTRPVSTDTVEHFIEKIYLPYCKATLRPSTYNSYDAYFRMVKPHLTGTRLRDFRTSDADRLLKAVAAEKPRAHTSLRNTKNFLSSAFRYAKRTDAIPENPVRDAVIPRGLPAGKTHAYTLEEIQAMLAVLPEPTRTAVLVFALTGLRLSEIKGLQWGDYRDGELHVSRGVWQGKISETKTLASTAAVPVLPIVAEALVAHRERVTGDTWIFAGRSGKPLRLENVLRREILPAFAKVQPRRLEWHGWHAFRRGLATNLYALGAPDKVIQAILRHAQVSTTMAYYVRPVAAESTAAMKKLERAFAAAKRKSA